jgi:uroporphyrinogen decarboxylase
MKKPKHMLTGVAIGDFKFTPETFFDDIRKYGDGKVFNYLSMKTPKEIENRCRLMLERTWERGGYALGSGNSIADYISDENYLALIRAAHEFKG